MFRYQNLFVCTRYDGKSDLFRELRSLSPFVVKSRGSSEGGIIGNEVISGVEVVDQAISPFIWTKIFVWTIIRYSHNKSYNFNTSHGLVVFNTSTFISY